ncbi:solute carrier organic anion transporter family member 4A1 isoform X2 [Nematostella vectensis]|uniref:solute carrier organic anion transporter family member 4A1 isoform X2 n=1 Tax=Nematostella vectensis TaxID=45351 RepID=UPI002076E45C|nr:solute carrier organic anion transporter family member 4A1 isoform X2 [Nematostella vectensis]
MKSERDHSTLAATHSVFGWWKLKPRCLQFMNSPKWFLFFLVMYFFTQSIVVNGVYSVSISTIEKRYGYTSSRTGFLTSSYDVAALVLTPLVSFLGARRKKPVWCGVGLLTMGIGMLIFFLPHVFGGRYEAGGSQLVRSTGLCNSTSGSLNTCESTSGNKGYFPLFVLGMLVMGSGATPMIALGIPYMDENVKAKVSPMYVGIFYSSGIFGAFIGYILAGVFLAMYVDIGVQTPLNPKDERWVGAWWPGFVVCGTLCILWSFWLFGFPSRITRNGGDIPDKEMELTKDKQWLAKEVLHLPQSTKRLLLNIPYTSTSIAGCAEWLVLSGFAAFAPKFLQSQFGIPAAQIGFLYGVITVPACLCGSLLGSYINKRLRLSMTGAAKMCLIVASASAVVTLPLLSSCATVSMAGVNTPYSNSSSTLSLENTCNSDCACVTVPYSPVCNAGMTYYSSCHAGCLDRNANKSFSSCSCLATPNALMLPGRCMTFCGNTFWLLLATVFMFGFLTFLNETPATIVTLRCLSLDERTYGVGFQMTMARLLGSIPGPILFGSLFDLACILWDKRCDGQGNCLEYNNTQLAYTVFGLCFVCKLVVIMGFLVSYLSCRRINKSTRLRQDDKAQKQTTHL